MNDIKVQDFGYVTPWPQPAREECLFYHSFDLPNGESISGEWDMRGRFPDYTGGIDLAGKRVLDIGTASGFLSFEAEKAGAREVVSFDADSTARYNRLPFADSRYARDPDAAIAEDNKWLDAVKRSYWYVHHANRSKVKAFYGNVLHLPPALGTFEVALAGQFLVHNRSAIDILESVARTVTERMVVIEGLWEVEEPAAKFIGRAERANDFFSNWLYSPSFYYEVMAMLGFEVEHFSRAIFLCNHPAHQKDITLGVFVFRRRRPRP